jgi:hypothetical protein
MEEDERKERKNKNEGIFLELGQLDKGSARVALRNESCLFG